MPGANAERSATYMNSLGNKGAAAAAAATASCADVAIPYKNAPALADVHYQSEKEFIQFNP